MLITLLSEIDFAVIQESVKVSSPNLQEFLQNALQWINSLGAIGGIVFIGIYIIATLAFLPAALLTLGAGVIFGVIWGSIYVFIGATLGAIAAFLGGRYLAQGWVKEKISSYKKFAIIDKAVSKEGLKIVLLVRLSPLFPFNLLNYALGITSVSFQDYLIGSVGMIPGTIMYVYFGSLVGDIALIGSKNQPGNIILHWVIQIMGLIATIAVTVYVTKIAKKALKDENL
ncbi:TVP38/TMEM64 family inner membrane protein YdjZ [Dolichospermum sp. UHCC 0315A]|uniref:TVP38/TMEM64 family protein n=1 Tax=Dolichospermum sp. UHCC 0315A TaxID=1914871 RepID=UPI0011E71C46|nr:TVP38/TMEM64 family protein [Dolichospermum sp. UHCC 0315A]QEI41868.1 TVP38/TMEM64 family inner membrane protein YdjZ [Dolichospermum sp. UHCC 0315A]